MPAGDHPEPSRQHETRAIQGTQMIKLHRQAGDGFLGKAVAAAMPSLLGHAAAKLDGYVGGAHFEATRAETSWPRSFRSLAACALLNMLRS